MGREEVAEKKVKSIELVDNSNASVVLSSLTKDSINMLRTESGGTDGTVYFNGKEYMTMKGMSPHLLKNYKNTPLPSGNTEFVFDNIGWRGVVVSLVIGTQQGTYGPDLKNVTVTAKYDGSEVEYTCRVGGVNRIEIPPYVDYILVFGEKAGFIAPDPVSGEGGREAVASYTVYYTGESDLSMLSPLDGSIMEKRETANCYVLHSPGVYDIPLVYGCSIKDDVENSESYKYTSTYSTTTQPFYDGVGNEIVGHDIVSNINLLSELTLVDSEDFIIDNNSISFFTKPITLDNIPTTIHYMRFKCTSIPSLGGNAILSIKDPLTKEILWSWHLWGFPYYIQTLSHTGIDLNEYQVMKVNLGWTYLDNTHIKGFAPYYQWGRKDPMLRYGTKAAQETEFNISPMPAIGVSDSIKHPNTFFMGANSSGNWWIDKNGNNQLFYNYWDSNKISSASTSGATHKTVYDPCPRGFYVPSSSFFENYVLEEEEVFDEGYMLEGRYYQALGYISSLDGKYGNVYTDGYYWTTWSTGSDCGGQAFKFYKNTLDIFATGSNAFATQIVPVRVIENS